MATNLNIGVVSLGVMGSSIAFSLRESGHSVIWASEGRSQKTQKRALSVGAFDVVTMEELSKRSDLIMCVGFGNCGPETAEKLVKTGFDKLLVDFNSLWGEQSEKKFYEITAKGKYEYVDGAIHGYPLNEIFKKDGLTRLMLLHGEKAEFVGSLFIDSVWTIVNCKETAKKENRIMSQQPYRTMESYT
jgi:hypothetical protein